MKESIPKDEVKESTPKIEINKEIKKENKIDCSASEILQKYRITNNTPKGTIKRILVQLLEDIENAAKSNNDVNESVTEAKEFKKQIDKCDCNLCNKIKDFSNYAELSDQVNFYNEKK